MQRLIQFLIVSIAFSVSLGCSAVNDSFTYEGKAKDLLRYFDIDKRFFSDGLIRLRFNRSGLSYLNDKRCSVNFYVRYLEGEKGYAFSSRSDFDEVGGFTFEIIDKTLVYGGSVYFSYEVEKGGCVLDENYNYSKSYFFSGGILK